MRENVISRPCRHRVKPAVAMWHRKTSSPVLLSVLGARARPPDMGAIARYKICVRKCKQRPHGVTTAKTTQSHSRLSIECRFGVGTALHVNSAHARIGKNKRPKRYAIRLVAPPQPASTRTLAEWKPPASYQSRAWRNHAKCVIAPNFTPAKRRNQISIYINENINMRRGITRKRYLALSPSSAGRAYIGIK